MKSFSAIGRHRSDYTTKIAAAYSATSLRKAAVRKKTSVNTTMLEVM